MNTDHSDSQLLALMAGVANQDSRSFNQLCDAVRNILTATIYKVLNHREDSEDVCQDVLIKVWNNAHSFDPSKGKPLTWLRTLARNRAIDRLRSKQRRSELNQRFRAEVETVNPRLSRHLSDEVSIREHASIVRDAVFTLSPEQQQVVKLAYFGGLTQSEIASRLKQPLGTVKARIRRSVKSLRDRVSSAVIISN